MKRLIAITILLVLGTASTYAVNYEETMGNTIAKMYQSTTSVELTGLANQFSRIANAESDKWLPGYYSAYCFVRTTFFGEMSSEEKHKNLDMAQAEIDKIVKKAPEESEIYALQSLVYMLRITDVSLGYKYSTLALQALGMAEKLNPNNPRVYYLRGTNAFNTPENFGGGVEKAKPFLEKAAAMFASQEQSNKLDPSWGEVHTNQLLKQCN